MIKVCNRDLTQIPLMVNVFIDIAGCPSSSQKQIIEDQITAMFKRICPSIPLKTKQLELIIATGPEGRSVNVAVRSEIVGYENATPLIREADPVYADACKIEEPGVGCVNAVP